VALTLSQKEIIRVAVKSDYYDAVNNPNGMSNRKIASKAGCSESAVRTLIRKEGLEKNAINALAKADAHTTIIQEEIGIQKNALNNAEKNAYDAVFKDAKQTIQIATDFQTIIQQRQKMDSETIDALIKMKAHDLKEAETPEDVLRVNFKYREYMAVVSDFKDIKDGIEANDKAMITKGEAPRFAPKSDTTVNNLTITDTEAGTKGKW